MTRKKTTARQPKVREHRPPAKIGGTPVEVMGEPLEVNGELWVTLVPPGDDDRLWEWSLTTGRLIETRS